MKRTRTGKGSMTTMCLGCASMIDQKTTGRWRDYCSSACRQRAYRQRRHPGVTEPTRPSEFRNTP